MSDYDSPWKEALDLYFEPFLLFFFPQAHADIDWTRPYETLDKELQKIVPAAEQGRRIVDKLVKVWLKTGEERWLLIHVEVQTWQETGFARRMHVYNYRIFDHYNRETISLAVLADDDLDWRPNHYGYARWGFRTSTEFGGVLLVLPSFQLLSRLLSAAWPLFPLPVTGWNRDGRPQNLLLPESAVSRLRPSRFGQSSGVLPQWPPQGTPCPGLPHLPETLLRAQGYGPVPLQARRR
jgi:hypothetical protein